MKNNSTIEKVVFIGNFAPDQQQSMLRFTQLLADGFSARGVPVEIWSPTPRFSKLSPGGYRYGGLPKYLGYLDKFFCFPRELRRRVRSQPRGTVYHITDHANAVYAPHLDGLPVVVTINDLLQIRSALGEFPQNRLSRSGTRFQQWILKSLKRVRIAACISHKTHEDLLRLTSLPPENAHVIQMSLNHDYRPMTPIEAAPLFARALVRNDVPPLTVLPGLTAIVPQVSSKPEPFFLSVSGAQWYKNRTGLISIFAALRNIPATSQHKLVYVGPDFDSEQQYLIAKHRLGGAIIHLRNLDNTELNAAYALARALIFPSWEEGFGWPIAEAQACGCPTFTTNRAPMTEVGGNAASYIDPAHPIAAAAHIAQTLAVSENQLRESGLAEAGRWKPEIMLDGYEGLYRKAARA